MNTGFELQYKYGNIHDAIFTTFRIEFNVIHHGSESRTTGCCRAPQFLMIRHEFETRHVEFQYKYI